MAYETFERSAVTIEEPALTIAPASDGRIALNAAAARLFERAGIKAVKILWDRTTCGLALQAAQKGDDNSFSVVFAGRHSQANVTAKTFLRYIGWASPRRQTVRAKWDEQHRILEAELPTRFVSGREPKDTKQRAGTVS